MRTKRFVVLTTAVVLAMSVAGCSSSSGAAGGGSSGRAEVQVAASISVLGDMTEEVGGERVEVSTIVPVGASVETFQPSPSDAREISEADLVVQNGAGLESWMNGLIESAGGEDKPSIELSEGLEPVDGNPHFWLDVENAKHYVQGIRDALIEIDPEGEQEYRRNAEEYLGELEELDGYIEERVQEIPEENRKLVTTHDAFPYFAEAYGFELAGVVIQNPGAEPGSREVAGIVRTVEREDVPAIFTEPQFDSKLADTIAEEAGVEVAELYSDTLVDTRSGGSYEAMMRANIDRIVEALG